eukprot:CAMPEP_0195542346 /NCGR_PEP_ID=MMETSP0794_2-20130614/51560_1 /TAXON_ID=515487 /ORGANISM="Stephanopyxis turris, Strain CCMP 815" /LENGTH=152 /DNA_ID=CAMNT_0040676477 /DNA_START=365 /DNA_END=820 /DNA_ORIENTATION=+
MHQIEKILEVTGKPVEKDIKAMQSPFAATMIESFSLNEQTSLSDICRRSSSEALDPEALDLMNQCLQFNPEKRCSSEFALMHPYIAEFHNPDNEPTHPHGPIQIDIDDNTKLSADDYRERLYREIQQRRKEAREKGHQFVRKKGSIAAVLQS